MQRMAWDLTLFTPSLGKI